MKGFVPLSRQVFVLLGSDRGKAYGLMLANLLLVMALFAEPIIFGRVIDVLTQLQKSQMHGLWGDTSALLFAWVSVGLFAIVTSSWIALIADRIAHRRRHIVLRDYFERVLSQATLDRQSQHTGRLMKVMLQATDALWALWLGFFRDYFAAAIAIVVLMPIAFYLNWPLASLLLLLCLGFVILTLAVIRKTDALQGAVENHYSDMAEHIADSLGNITLIQSFGRVQAEVATLRRLSGNVIKAQFPALSWWAFVNVLTRSATTLTVLAMLVLGLFLFAHDRASIGDIVMFIGFSGLIIARLEQAVAFGNRLSVEAPKLREFFEIFQAPLVADAIDAVEPDTVRPRIEFRDVTFRYNHTSQPAVDQFSLTIEPGETVALVGLSGAGKSTVLSLLCRFFEPQEGAISIDGTDIRQWRLAALRRQIGVVFQEDLLFNRSVADNLAIGLPEATDAQLRQAASDARALEFIDQLPQGFATKVGERGRNLSGGQRQRLAIARVLLKDPAILVLDEATSALDVQTEALVQEAMTKVRQGRTTLMIAHRLSTIRCADRIVFMSRGRVMEVGSFNELIRRGGEFAQMVSMQLSRED